MPNDLIDKIIGEVVSDARIRREDAGFGGRMDDGGYESTMEQVKFYNYGREGKTPPEWSKYVKLVEKQEDPEYLEYIRLKTKFENGIPE